MKMNRNQTIANLLSDNSVDPVTEDTPTPEVWNGTMDLYYACYHGGAGTIAIASRQYIYDSIHVTVRVVLDNHILKADITQVQGGVERYALVDYARAERVLELVHQLDHDPTATDLYAIIEIMRDYEGAPCPVDIWPAYPASEMMIDRGA